MGLYIAIAIVLLIIQHYTSTFRVLLNFHEIDPGKFFRSAQITAKELEKLVKTHNIKTVINLRGEQLNKRWYRKELAKAKELGILYLPIGFNSNAINSQESLIAYLEALKTAPRPIWVHCRSGADRAGEATALYSIEYMGYPKDQAKKEFLSFKYLHTRWLNPSKHYFLDIYKGLDWIRTEYDPCKPPYLKMYEKKHCRAKEKLAKEKQT